jgi:hypothetical protein
MEGVNRKDLNEANIVAYALALALFAEQTSPDRRRIIERALTFLPPEPGAGEPPGNRQMWMEAQRALKELGGMPV